MLRRLLALLLALVLAVSLAGCTPGEQKLAEKRLDEDISKVQSEPAAPERAEPERAPNQQAPPAAIDEHGAYTDVDSVARYIHTYGKLPSNYITKKEAEKRGWNSRQGNLAEVLPGMSIGGDHYGNYEKLLPTAKGRSYRECDIDYREGRRNAKRIVFSNDGLIFYTDDHYASFEQLY